MKYLSKVYIFLLLIPIIILTSCNGIEKKEYRIDATVDLNIDDIIDVELAEDWNTVRYNLSNPHEEPNLDYYISSGSQADGQIYYISSGFEPMSNDCLVYEILKKDINSGEIEKVFTNNEDDYKQVSVMKYANDNLFWVEENEVGWSLIKYDLKEEEYEVLDSSDTNPSTLSPNIEVCDGSLFWYIIFDSNNIKLFQYSILDKKIEDIKEKNHYLESPFNTVRCSQGYMTYLTQDEEKIIINIKDTNTNEFSRIKADSNKVVYAISNENYIIWLEDRHDSTLNIYELETNTLKSIACSKNNIRSVAIDESNILIDFSAIYMNEDSEFSAADSGVFKFDFTNSTLGPIYISERNETLAWIDGVNGDFSINSWENGDDKFINQKIIFTNKGN